jgi:hypothetical protein
VEDLCVKRYNVTEIRDYVRESLGSGLFKVELTNVQIDNAITDALLEYGKRIPLIASKIIEVSPNVRDYDIDDCGYGVFDVQFITDDVRPAAVFYMGLLGDKVPLNSVMLAEYDSFLRYRKTMMRATSVAPQWEWNDSNPDILLIYAPVFNLKAAYSWYAPRPLSRVKLEHQKWVRDYTLAKSKVTLGQVRSKFSGVLPGPARDLQLNGQELAAEGREEIKALEEFLLGVQGDIPPMIR